MVSFLVMDGCDKSAIFQNFANSDRVAPSTKDSIKTSSLLKRWESVWLRVPELELTLNDLPDGQALESFVNKFLEFNKGSNAIYNPRNAMVMTRGVD
ncbi:unnamed protein product [Microthlaspi erraticum]|uniref:Uncharacterized protein n=1 Tax=Microthlaspi erraticum TaxID=1685480 RepID=A0A6D2KNX1_9BRAS|nr:unnamed protein product [Microthlaspi erraticum]